MANMLPEQKKMLFFGLFGIVIGTVTGFGAAMIFYAPRCLCPAFF